MDVSSSESDYQPRIRRAGRRRSSIVNQSEFEAPADWNPASLYSNDSRPPPSAFPFPFQSYAGNPDPGMPIPGISSKRSSMESISAVRRHSEELARPQPPFMAATQESAPSGSGSSTPNSIYRNSVGHNTSSMTNIPRNNSATFRAPFLSPASRPTSSLWSPPTHPSPAASNTALPIPKAPPPFPSTRLAQPLTKEDKPWLTRKLPRDRISYWVTFFLIALGWIAAACLVFFGTRGVNLLSDDQLCMVLDEQFNGGDINTDIWQYDVGLGGFGNGEFQVMTKESRNARIQNGELWIIPTLTSDNLDGGKDAILDGGEYDLGDACSTPDNKSNCAVKSNGRTVIPPVESARLTTKGTASIKYGRVQIRARLPLGDWLWPALWMLPVSDEYGPWPLSGEIDIMESRGNGIEYPFQGVNYVRSSFNYGPMAALLTQIFGWWSMKREGFNQQFHVYTLEWTPQWMRVFVDSRLHAMLDLSIKKEKESFFNRGGFPQTAQNGSSQVVVPNPWSGQGWNAPFDQDFYLILSMAAGGTSGWFPDSPDKPWHDGSLSAMKDFATVQDQWSATWPSNEADRALRIDYVKMWQLGGCPK
ncbi:hypothetical protein VNI00_000042 [Paramarasmius palmivorus]|uniref:GH16 domain-containing protein n=1 Tax=Paramarasmius palmivorus TaxID=297713 RepID=A0AAW0EE72_9AGAR